MENIQNIISKHNSNLIKGAQPAPLHVIVKMCVLWKGNVNRVELCIKLPYTYQITRLKNMLGSVRENLKKDTKNTLEVLRLEN